LLPSISQFRRAALPPIQPTGSSCHGQHRRAASGAPRSRSGGEVSPRPSPGLILSRPSLIVVSARLMLSALVTLRVRTRAVCFDPNFSASTKNKASIVGELWPAEFGRIFRLGQQGGIFSCFCSIRASYGHSRDELLLSSLCLTCLPCTVT
jgi:hypothetical protein